MAFLFFALGAVAGSFINVCVYRLPRDLSIVFPGSRCPLCREPIAWHDNIPILSYFFLRRRCRHCRAPIGFRYPLVEALAGLLVLSAYLHSGLTIGFPFYAVFFLALLLVTFIDWEHHLIPVGEVVLPGILFGIAANALFPSLSGAPGRLDSFLNSVLGAFAGAFIILAVARLGRIVFRKEAMGEGDIWLMAMIGAFLGWRAVLITVLAGSFAGSVVGVSLMASGLKKKDEPIPFGPFLSLGAIFSFFLGEKLIGWYLGFF